MPESAPETEDIALTLSLRDIDSSLSKPGESPHIESPAIAPGDELPVWRDSSFDLLQGLEVIEHACASALGLLDELDDEPDTTDPAPA